MLIDTAQRVRGGLAELIRLVNDADTSTAAARRVLEDSKAFGAQVAVLQADAAALVAKRDRHGDGGHHVEPVSRGGPTNIDNMMLLCWWCHQKVHHHGWREVPDGRGLYTIEPPERIRHGPAHAADPPSDHGPAPPRRSRQPEPPSMGKPVLDRMDPAPPAQPEPLFAVT